MSLLNRCSSSSCMAKAPGVEGGADAKTLSRARERRGPHRGPGASGGVAPLFGRLRRVLGSELAKLDGGFAQPGQVVEAQIPAPVTVLESHPDLGPPGLLVVALGSLHGADDLHHFRFVHDSCP